MLTERLMFIQWVFLFALALATVMGGAFLLLALIALAAGHGRRLAGFLRRLLCRLFFDCFGKGPDSGRRPV